MLLMKNEENLPLETEKVSDSASEVSYSFAQFVCGLIFGQTVS